MEKNRIVLNWIIEAEKFYFNYLKGKWSIAWAFREAYHFNLDIRKDIDSKLIEMGYEEKLNDEPGVFHLWIIYILIPEYENLRVLDDNLFFGAIKNILENFMKSL